MLDFICELERVVGKWPENTSWTVAQLADYTATGVPQVVDILSDTLGRELEVHEGLTLTDAAQALTLLKDRMQSQLAARQRRVEQRREKAIQAYDGAMEKVRVLLASKNTRAAYKTLSYFVGCHEKDISDELLLTLSSECLRLGIKAEANLQELSQWLRKGIAACLHASSADSIEDALDFIDAYSDFFAASADDRGRRLLGTVMSGLKVHAESFNLVPQFDALAKELRIG